MDLLPRKGQGQLNSNGQMWLPNKGVARVSCDILSCFYMLLCSCRVYFLWECRDLWVILDLDLEDGNRFLI